MEGWLRVGSGARSEIYARGGRAIKLFAPGYPRVNAFREAYLTSLVERAGLPVARVFEVTELGGRIALVMDYVDGVPVADLLLADAAGAADRFRELVALQKRVQAARVRLPFRVKDRLRANIAASCADPDRLRALLSYLDALPDGEALCHGDFHGYNVLAQGEAYTIIDWPDASCGPAEADACRTYLLYALYRPDVAELFLERYCEGQPERRRDVLAWLPVVAAARRAEGFDEDVIPPEWERLPGDEAR